MRDRRGDCSCHPAAKPAISFGDEITTSQVMRGDGTTWHIAARSWTRCAGATVRPDNVRLQRTVVVACRRVGS